MSNLQDRLKAIRKHKGLTQGALGDLIGLTTGAISAIEKGHSANPDTLKAIAQKLKIDYLWLSTGEGIAPKDLILTTSESQKDNPWRDALVAQQKAEIERLWQIINHFTGNGNFPKSPNLSGIKLRAVRGGVQLGDYLSKVA